MGGQLTYKDWSSPDVVFDLIDNDNSGAVTKSELRQFFRGSPLDPTKQEELFDALDIDGSGEVSRDEWRQGFFKAGFDGSAIVGQSTEGLGVLLGLVAAPRLTSFGGNQIKCFEDLAYGRMPASVPLAEERGITLHQLRTLWIHIQSRCIPEGWMGVDGKLLSPEKVSMYDVIRYVVKPATRKHGCSYVELVSEGPQRPSWVVIHWWGQPVQEVLASLEQHSKDRGVSDEVASYWIASFAFNQHVNTPFGSEAERALNKAMSTSFGTVALLDREGTVFKRVCFLYELHAALARNQTTAFAAHRIDFYAALQHVDRKLRAAYALGLSDGFVMSDFRDNEANKVVREAQFPMGIVEAAVELSIQSSNASNENDKRHILGTFAKRDPQSHDPFTPIELALRGRVAVAALRCAIDDGRTGRPLYNRCLDTIKHSGLSDITLNFSGCRGFTHETAENLAVGLPASLMGFTIYFNDVDPEVADHFMNAISAAVPQRLRRIQKLGFISNSFGEDGGFCLSRCLRDVSPTLRSIDFGIPAPFDHPKVASAITAIRSPLKLSYCGSTRMASSVLNFSGQALTVCDIILIVASAARGVPEKLTSLDLSVNNINNEGVAALAKAIRQNQLPDLNFIDISSNPAGNKFELLDALKARGEKAGQDLRERAAKEGRGSPDGLIIPKFECRPGHEFKIVAVGGPPMEDD